MRRIVLDMCGVNERRYFLYGSKFTIAQSTWSFCSWKENAASENVDEKYKFENILTIFPHAWVYFQLIMKMLSKDCGYLQEMFSVVWRSFKLFGEVFSCLVKFSVVW